MNSGNAAINACSPWLSAFQITASASDVNAYTPALVNSEDTSSLPAATHRTEEERVEHGLQTDDDRREREDVSGPHR